LKGFAKEHYLKLFRLVVSSYRTDYVVTNDLSQDSTDDTRDQSAIRWKIEQFHREAKQGPVLSLVNVGLSVPNAIISPVPCWSGFA